MSNSYIKFRNVTTGLKKKPEDIGKKIPVPPGLTDAPVANPDFAQQIDQVHTWLIEFEDDSYFANREIGLNESGKTIMIMPWGRNYGYWTDNNLTIANFRSSFKVINISREEFERSWKGFEL